LVIINKIVLCILDIISYIQYNIITKLKNTVFSIKNPVFLTKTLYIFTTMVYNIVTTDILFYSISSDVDEEEKRF
jgi:hypothetical protein